MIPKIIHYCWFGGKELPDDIKECMDTWQKLQGYQICRWDESNCTFDENEFVRKAWHEKRYAFLNDYYRLKCLYTHGGVYLDTDVKVKRSFDDLLNFPCFMGFMVNCCLMTAVIGAEKGNPVIGGLLELYDNIRFTDQELNERIELHEDDNLLYVNRFDTNNYYFTWYFLRRFPEFKLNNTYQELDGVAVFPKEYFETGAILKKYYTVHQNYGGWKEKPEKPIMYNRIKYITKACPWLFDHIQIVVRLLRSGRMNRANPFYGRGR